MSDCGTYLDYELFLLMSMGFINNHVEISCYFQCGT